MDTFAHQYTQIQPVFNQQMVRLNEKLMGLESECLYIGSTLCSPIDGLWVWLSASPPLSLTGSLKGLKTAKASAGSEIPGAYPG